MPRKPRGSKTRPRLLALLGVAWTIATQRDEALDLSGVEIPGQRDALALIKQIDATEAKAQLMLRGELTKTLTPVDKLSFGRRINAALPPRPTARRG